MACAEKIHFRSHLFPTEEKKEALAATLLHKSLEDEKREEEKGSFFDTTNSCRFWGVRRLPRGCPFFIVERVRLKP